MSDDLSRALYSRVTWLRLRRFCSSTVEIPAFFSAVPQSVEDERLCWQQLQAFLSQKYHKFVRRHELELRLLSTSTLWQPGQLRYGLSRDHSSHPPLLSWWQPDKMLPWTLCSAALPSSAPTSGGDIQRRVGMQRLLAAIVLLRAVDTAESQLILRSTPENWASKGLDWVKPGWASRIRLGWADAVWVKHLVLSYFWRKLQGVYGKPISHSHGKAKSPDFQILPSQFNLDQCAWCAGVVGLSSGLNPASR